MKQAQIDHAVVDVLLVDGDKFLLVEEGKPGREGLFNLPGGHINTDESIFDAAVREAKEETGFEVTLTGLVGIYQSIYTHLNISGPVLSAEIRSGKPALTAEHPSQKWVAKDELDKLAADGKLFTTYPPYAVADYLRRGTLPLDTIVSHNYSALMARG